MIITIKTDNLELEVELFYWEGELNCYEVVAWSCYTLDTITSELVRGDYTLVDILNIEWLNKSDSYKREVIKEVVTK